MSNVAILLRVRRPDGSRAHYPAVTASNGRLKPLYGVVEGKPIHLPHASYYLRYTLRGRRTFECCGTDSAQVLTKKLQREHLLAGEKLDLGPKYPDPAPRPKVSRLEMLPTIHQHIVHVEATRGRKTAGKYEVDLMDFASACPRKFVDEITRQDVQTFIAKAVAKKRSPKTISNRLTTLKAFLRKCGFDGKIVNQNDAPRVPKKIPHVYTKAQVTALLQASATEDRLIWEVFLSIGLRERELSFLGYEDLNFETRIVHIHAKEDLGFQLKDAEERQVPMPLALKEKLYRRRENRPKDRLVFPTEDGKPDGHLLRRLKRVAFAAGLNCGNCVNRAGKKCSDGPVCSKWQLHSFRRTAATRWHEAGLSVPTVQRLLGHSDVETTMSYLTGQDLGGAELRASIDGCFASMTG